MDHGFSNLSYLGVNASDQLPKGVAFALPALTKFFSIPSACKAFVVIAFMLSILWWTPVGFMLGTRNLFAWSFDHLAPSWISDVHKTLHTPVKATIIMAVYIELLNFLNIYAGLGNFLINIIAVMAASFIVVGLAAVMFPYRRKDLFDNAPDLVRKKIAGIPVMTIAGIVTMLSWSFVLIAAFSASQFGMKVEPIAMIEAFCVPVIAIIWYAVAVSIRKHQGIDMHKVFSEIPPE
jgi:APA family basic amino acid/polyamine antiporter